MNWKTEVWDYAESPEQKERLLKKVASITSFDVVVNEELDEVIVIGDSARPLNKKQADVIAAALNSAWPEPTAEQREIMAGIEQNTGLRMKWQPSNRTLLIGGQKAKRDQETIRLLSDLLDQVAEAAGLPEKDRGEPDTLVETIEILVEENLQMKALLAAREATHE